MTKKIEYRFYKLVFPVEFTLEQSLDFFDTVAASLKRGRLGTSPETMVLELWSNKEGLTHRVGLPWERSELVDQLRGHLPGIHIEEHERASIPEWTHIIELGVNDGTRPFNLPRVHAQAKRILSAAIAEMKHDDTLVMQWVVSAADRIAPPTPQNPPASSSWGALWRGKRADSQELAERRENASQSQFRGVLRLAASSSTEAHAKKLVSNMKKALKAPETAAVHFTEQWWTRKHKRVERLNKGLPLVAPVHFINATELAAFSGWPIGVSALAGLSIGKTRYLPPSINIPRDGGATLGKSIYKEFSEQRITLATNEFSRHMYVIGPSGRGKSVLLGNVAQQWVEQGNGLVVMESKGDLFYRMLDSIPYERINDVRVVDLSNKKYSASINLPQAGSIEQLEAMLLHNQGDGLYLKRVMHHALRTLALFPQLTIVDMLTFLDPETPMETAWRDNLIASIPRKNPLRAHWDAFFKQKDSARLEQVKPVANRIWELTSRETVRNFLGQSKTTIDMEDILLNNRILLVYLPQSLGPSVISTVGGLIVNGLIQASERVGEQQETPTPVMMDEAQRFLQLPFDIPDTLSTSRSRKLPFVLAHQYTNQLTREIQSALANVSTKIALRLDQVEARDVQRLFGGGTIPQDFENLDAYQAIVSVATPDGGVSGPTVMQMRPRYKPHGHAELILRTNRANNMASSEAIENEIRQRRIVRSRPQRRSEVVIGDEMKDEVENDD